MTISAKTPKFDNSFVREMEGFYAPWPGEAAPKPEAVFLNDELGKSLGFDDLSDANVIATLAGGGGAPMEGAETIAQVYAGHQFGGFSPQLGDGRALLLGEVIDADGNRRDIALKGSGRTPFSRGGDGKAVLGPVLREYIFGEAMHKLGIPTTRALAAVTTGEVVARDGRPKAGAVIARVAASHLRVGTFQFFAARGETEKVKQLADYAIARHYPEHKGDYLGFLRAVIDAQLDLIVRWMAVGFVHGVMNTDNITISGETIDYGPCAFIDDYSPSAVFSSIDRDGRYAYGNQPVILQWNLARFAETLLSLLNPEDSEDAVRMATNEINAIPSKYLEIWLDKMRPKFGMNGAQEGDDALINQAHELMEAGKIDFTKFFRGLGASAEGDDLELLELFDDGIKGAEWLGKWRARVGDADRTAMDAINPVYIPRNHLVDAALNAADDGDLSNVKALLTALASPFTPLDGFDEYAHPAPDDFGPFKTFCGT